MKFGALLILFTIFLSGTAHAQFVGNLVLQPSDCEKSGQCTLGEDFGFIDSSNIGWLAAKGNVTDGASIPRWARKFIGEPFDPAYLKAAVIHDHYSYSGRPVRGWLETQRVFHEMLIVLNVPRDKAAIMYGGVLIGSKKWIVRVKGKPCDIGQVCTYSAEMQLVEEPERYGTDAYAADYAKLKAAVIDKGATSAREVEALALMVEPDSIYLNNPSGIVRGDYSDLVIFKDLFAR